MLEHHSELTTASATGSFLPLCADPQHEIATLLRLAWSEIRLERIRRTVAETIASLQSLPASHFLGRELAAEELSGFRIDPVQQAVRDCCNELLEGSGLEREGLELKPDADPSWTDLYAAALSACRRSATSTLRSSFAVS